MFTLVFYHSRLSIFVLLFKTSVFSLLELVKLFSSFLFLSSRQCSSPWIFWVEFLFFIINLFIVSNLILAMQSRISTKKRFSSTENFSRLHSLVQMNSHFVPCQKSSQSELKFNRELEVRCPTYIQRWYSARVLMTRHPRHSNLKSQSLHYFYVDGMVVWSYQ